MRGQKINHSNEIKRQRSLYILLLHLYGLLDDFVGCLLRLFDCKHKCSFIFLVVICCLWTEPVGIFGCGRTWCLPWGVSALWLTFLNLVTAGVALICLLLTAVCVIVNGTKTPWLTSSIPDKKIKVMFTFMVMVMPRESVLQDYSWCPFGTVELWCSCERHR